MAKNAFKDKMNLMRTATGKRATIDIKHQLDDILDGSSDDVGPEIQKLQRQLLESTLKIRGLR